MKNFATTQLSNNTKETLRIKSGLRAKQYGPMLRDLVPQLEQVPMDKLAPIGKEIVEELYRGEKTTWPNALILCMLGRANGKNKTGASDAEKMKIMMRKEALPDTKEIAAFKAKLAVDMLQASGLVKLSGPYNFGYANCSVTPAVSAPATARKRPVRKTA